MKQRKKLGRKILGVLLTLAMIIGLMPGMSLTVRAYDDTLQVSPDGSGSITVDGNSYTAVPNPGWKFDHWYYMVDEGQSVGESTDNPWQFNGYELECLYAYFVAAGTYADYDVTTTANKEKSGDDLTALQVTFNGKPWYIIEDNSTAVNAGTVTLLAAENLADSRFHDSSSAYSTSTIRTTLDSMTASGGSFAEVESAINTVSVKGSESDTAVESKLWLLSVDEAKNVPENVRKFSIEWWLRSPGQYDERAAFVNSRSGNVDANGISVRSTQGVRPALQLDLSKVTFDSETKTFALPEAVTEYRLWVGDVQVTSANMDDVLGDKDSGATVTFTPATTGDAPTPAVLTLKDATITDYFAGVSVRYGVNDSLIVNLEGDNTIGQDSDDGLYTGIEVRGSLTIKGSGKLAVKGRYNGIKSDGDITIESGEITASGLNSGIESGNEKEITINGGKVSAKGNTGIIGYGGVTIVGAEVNAEGENYAVFTADKDVTITGGTVNATATGTGTWQKAINGTVKNSISGTGWTDAAGTEGKATIEKSMTGQDLSEYKKVQFPAVTSVYSLSLTDGTENAEKWKGKSGNDDEFKVLPLQEVVEGDNVIIQYTGSKRIENIKAVTENIATGTGSSTTETVILHEDTMQVSWVNTLEIAKDKFTDINPGDKIVIEYNCESGSSLELRCNGEKLPGSRIENFIVGNGSEEVYATPATIKSLKKYGLEICGDDFTVSKVWYGAGKDGVDEYTVWSGYFWMDNWNTIVLATSCFNGVDWSTIKAIRFMSDAGRTDYVMNVRTAWDDEGKIADQSSMTRNENYFELSLANIDMATKLNGSGSFMIQCNKEGGEPFSLTQIQLIPDENAKKEVELTPVEGQSNTWTLEMPAGNVELQVEYQPHVHDFVYTAEDATITATCTADGCDLTDSKATLTIVAPELNVYGGTESAEATISGSIPGVTTPDIVYSKGKKTLDAAPTNAGTYTASITIEGKTASVEYTIAKADPTFTKTVSITPSDFKSDDTTTKDGVTVATHTYTNPNGMSLMNGGTFTSSVGNITKIEMTAQNSPSGEGWTDGTWSGNSSSVSFGNTVFYFTEIVVTIESNPVPGELTATYGDTLADITLPTGWTWADDTQSVGSVGTKTFKATFTPEDTDNYNVLENLDVTVNVNKADNPATIKEIEPIVTKGGNTVDLSALIDLNGATGDVAYEITGEAKGCTLDGSILTSGDEIGTVTVNVSVAEDDNYNALAATPIKVTITDKKEQTITAPDVTVTFGDTDKSVSAETDGDGKLSYAVKEGSEDLIDIDPETGALTIKKAGTATVIVTATETMSYLGASKEVTVEVKKQEEPNVEPPEAKATISMNAGLKVTQKGSKIKVEWGKVKEADGYDVYLAYCSKKFGKPIKNVNKNTVKSVKLGKIGKKKINLKKNFKVYVVAYKMVDGKKVRLAKSIVGHVVGRKNAKYTNAKKIKLAKAKYTVAVGKKVKIKAKTILVNKKKKQLSNKHAKEFRYATTDKQIATVSKSGKIKGVKKGTCTVYVYARNGMAKKVTVTVK